MDLDYFAVLEILFGVMAACVWARERQRLRACHIREALARRRAVCSLREGCARVLRSMAAVVEGASLPCMASSSFYGRLFLKWQALPYMASSSLHGKLFLIWQAPS